MVICDWRNMEFIKTKNEIYNKMDNNQHNDYISHRV